MVLGTGSFTLDRSNAIGVMDIKTITATTSVTLKNGRFRIYSTSVHIILVAAELTVVGSVGSTITGDAGSTVIVDSSVAPQSPPVDSDGYLRLWNYDYEYVLAAIQYIH